MSRVGLYYRNYQLSEQKHLAQFSILRAAFRKHGIDLVECLNVFETDKIIESYNPDFVLFYDKDMFRARLFEKRGIVVFNNSLSLEVCDDKALAYMTVENVPGIKLIPSVVNPYPFADSDEFRRDCLLLSLSQFDYPYILKATKGSLGQQVFMVCSEQEYMERMKDLGLQQTITQSFVKSSYGRDLRVWVVGHRIIKTVIRQSRDDAEFRSSISLGGHYGDSYKLDKFEKNIVKGISTALRMDFGTIDFLFGDNNTLLFCEANTNAVFSNLDLSIGENIAEYVIRKIYG